MAVTINVQDAKTRLSDLLRRSERGEKIVIARAGVPIVELTPISPRKRDLSSPLLPNLPKGGGESLLEPMGQDDLFLWEGDSSTDPLADSGSK